MFKIDTKNGFHVMTSDTTLLDESFLQSFQVKLEEHCAGKMSTILHLEACVSATDSAKEELQKFQNYTQEHNVSFAICAEQTDLYTSLKGGSSNDELNLTPSLAEAIDLVAMEILERELLDGL